MSASTLTIAAAEPGIDCIAQLMQASSEPADTVASNTSVGALSQLAAELHHLALVSAFMAARSTLMDGPIVLQRYKDFQ
jgi:hypothetical protein